MELVLQKCLVLTSHTFNGKNGKFYTAELKNGEDRLQVVSNKIDFTQLPQDQFFGCTLFCTFRAQERLNQIFVSDAVPLPEKL